MFFLALSPYGTTSKPRSSRPGFSFYARALRKDETNGVNGFSLKPFRRIPDSIKRLRSAGSLRPTP